MNFLTIFYFFFLDVPVYCNTFFTINDIHLEYCFIYMNVYSKHLSLFIIRSTKYTILVWKVVNKLTLIVPKRCCCLTSLATEGAVFKHAFQHNCREQAENLRALKQSLAALL